MLVFIYFLIAVFSIPVCFLLFFIARLVTGKNCLTWAAQRFFKCGGELVIRKARTPPLHKGPRILRTLASHLIHVKWRPPGAQGNAEDQHYTLRPEQHATFWARGFFRGCLYALNFDGHVKTGDDEPPTAPARRSKNIHTR